MLVQKTALRLYFLPFSQRNVLSFGGFFKVRMGERSVRIREVKGSNPSRSIKKQAPCRVPARGLLFMLTWRGFEQSDGAAPFHRGIMQGRQGYRDAAPPVNRPANANREIMQMPMGQHSHRNRFISTHPLGLNWMPSRSNKCCCSGQLGAGRPAWLTTRWQG